MENNVLTRLAICFDAIATYAYSFLAIFAGHYNTIIWQESANTIWRNLSPAFIFYYTCANRNSIK